jgi:hypothetical protein
MRPLNLHSSLAGPIQNFINLRRLSGTDYKSQAQLLGYFDRFLLNQKRKTSRMTREITDCYQQSLSHLAPRSRSNRFCVSQAVVQVFGTKRSVQLCARTPENHPVQRDSPTLYLHPL